MPLCIACKRFRTWITSKEIIQASKPHNQTSWPISWNGSGLDLNHHRDLASLKSSAFNGCQLCQMLLKFLTGDHYLNLSSWRKHHLTFDFQLLRGQNGMVMYGGLCLQLYVQGDEHETWPSRCHQSADPLAPSTIDIAREWLRECIEDHDGCRVRFNPTYLPSRLIDVGHLDQSGNFSVPRLIETGERLSAGKLNIEKECQYVTLSHCWGKSTHLSTESDTLDERKKAIPLETLNKTYADAVRVTRGLQMRHLWIDSLCIIQDSEEDWIRESSKMCFVYNNATFNIAAAAALDGDSGFLPERLTVKLGHILRPDKKTEKRSLWIRPCIEKGGKREGEILLPCPLFGRAWVLQESILAARTLAYSPVGMHFRCRMSQKSDEDPSKDAQDLDILVGSKLVTFPYLALDKGLPQFYFPRAMDTWYQILGMYSAKEISERKDKLPAVAGLAYQLGSIIGDTYLAGLWSRHFPQALCWLPHIRICGCIRRCTLPGDSIYNAPSWSWASRNASFGYSPVAFTGPELLTQGLPSRYYPCPGSELMEILWDAMLVDAVIDCGSNLYGPVRSGTITMRGHLLKIDVEDCYVGPVRENAAKWKGLELGTFYADTFLDTRKAYWALLLGYERPQSMMKCWTSTGESGVVLKKREYRMERKICLGLILMKIKDGSFERVAYFEKFDAVWPPETREVIIR